MQFWNETFESHVQIGIVSQIDNTSNYYQLPVNLLQPSNRQSVNLHLYSTDTQEPQNTKSTLHIRRYHNDNPHPFFKILRVLEHPPTICVYTDSHLRQRTRVYTSRPLLKNVMQKSSAASTRPHYIARDKR